ncbi:MAG: DUF1092 family protein [Synechococcaceae cyanobacterium RL_1_2]|nr:DUF1092 family protein [Synechococcaceae cyanobacterium RL_1_2]
MGITWELDFYSRPIVDENKKKVWEVLICESPVSVTQSMDQLFSFSRFCPSDQVNSEFLRNAIADAIQQAGVKPQKVRFFRRQMSNMITKGVEDSGLEASPSRHTYAIERLLTQRTQEVYPKEPGYDPNLEKTGFVQYPDLNSINLPDAVRGDQGDKWAIVGLDRTQLQEMEEWEIGFKEAFPFDLISDPGQINNIPGLLMFSPRAEALAAWISGLELAFLSFEDGPLPRILLDTSVSDRWNLVNLTNEATVKEGKSFAEAKQQAQGVHFLAIQSDSESERFAGFWLLKG